MSSSGALKSNGSRSGTGRCRSGLCSTAFAGSLSGDIRCVIQLNLASSADSLPWPFSHQQPRLFQTCRRTLPVPKKNILSNVIIGFGLRWFSQPETLPHLLFLIFHLSWRWVILCRFLDQNLGAQQTKPWIKAHLPDAV